MKGVAGYYDHGLIAEKTHSLLYGYKDLKRKELLTALSSVLRYQQSCGIEYLTSVVRIDGLKRVQSLRNVNAGEGPGGFVTEKESPAGNRKLPGLHEMIFNCRNCSLHEGRKVSTAGSNDDARPPLELMVVGDWLTIFPEYPAASETLFGQEQDAMLWRMMKAIDLSNQKVYVTNVIKCSVPEMCQPTSAHIGHCSPYLDMQIDLLKPRIICSMGIIASRLLTGQSKPLSQQRGKSYTYRTGAGTKALVMPTYHPTFLIQNPEMKQAAWADLQAIKSHLAP